MRKYEIMVVDDTEINIDILVEGLAEDYGIQVATNGEDALRLVSQNLPDLILLDIIMPDMDGYEVCHRLKTDVKTRDIPVIFLTALTDIEEKTRGFSLGAVDFITKPFDIDEVRIRVSVQLGMYEEKRRLLLENQRLLEQRSQHTETRTDRALQVQQLIDYGESEHVEFKSTLRWDLNKNKKEMAIEIAWLKTIVAFLNSGGGKLLVGVKDDGTIAGLEADGFDNDDKCLLYINNRIKDSIGLEYAPHIDYQLVAIENSKVLLVTCRQSEDPVFLLQGKSESFYIRVGPGSRKLQPRQILTYVSERNKALRVNDHR